MEIVDVLSFTPSVSLRLSAARVRLTRSALAHAVGTPSTVITVPTSSRSIAGSSLNFAAFLALFFFLLFFFPCFFAPGATFGSKEQT